VVSGAPLRPACMWSGPGNCMTPCCRSTHNMPPCHPHSGATSSCATSAAWACVASGWPQHAACSKRRMAPARSGCGCCTAASAQSSQRALRPVGVQWGGAAGSRLGGACVLSRVTRL
jgi:hypothetical protein